MRYRITGKQIDIGKALQTHVRQELDALADKWAERPTSVQVTFSRSGHEHVCEIEMHLSTGVSPTARARANDIYAAFDAAAERVGKQLRRYKRRLKNHKDKTRANGVELPAAAAYILAAPETGPEDEETVEPGTEPVIIAEMEQSVPTLTVSEAVMQMELAGAPILVFRNEARDRVNVIYRRNDGNIGWIDPR